MTRTLLIVLWLVLACVPFGWWLLRRRRPDGWASLPVPGALLDGRGRVLALTGPTAQVRFDDLVVPQPGQYLRHRGADGSELAVSGVPGGAVAVALSSQQLHDRRDSVLAELGARLAHDINTPLAALVGHLDLIAHEPISDRAADSVAVCQREVERLSTTAANLLALTRLRAGGAPRRVALAGALVEDAVGAFLDAADRCEVTIEIDVPRERVAVEVAEADLVRALRNLVSNALNYGLTGGHDLRVMAEVDGAGVRFSVADRGPGLTAADVAALSAPMVRGPAAPGEGSGLGLAIVHEVLATHGSSLECTPRSGGGTVLSFRLPRVP